MFGISPWRFCFRPWLNIFIRVLRVGDLAPAIVVAGAVVATVQSERGDAKSGNEKTGHRKIRAVR
jgi:hypothetical protein